MSEIKLGSRLIERSSKPYIIAEIGVNHEGSFELAKRLIELAKEGGADAAKFQSYKAGTLAAKASPSYWDLSKEKTTSQFELFKKYDSFGHAEYEALKAHCDKVGIEFLSTPFDDEAVDYLDPLVSFFKIASADLTNMPFLKKVASKKKPVVLSTGASRMSEIAIAVETLRRAGCEEIALLHCILNYPTAPKNAHLNMIEDLAIHYPELVIGYSDHTPPDPEMWALTISYLKGARIIEKHFTHDKTLPGNDHYHAMTAEDCRRFLQKVDESTAYLGSALKAPIPTEGISRKNARRSVVTKGPIAKGELFTEANLTCKRPGTGINPKVFGSLVGKRAARDLQDDHILNWDDVTGHRDDQTLVVVVSKQSTVAPSERSQYADEVLVDRDPSTDTVKKLLTVAQKTGADAILWLPADVAPDLDAIFGKYLDTRPEAILFQSGSLFSTALLRELEETIPAGIHRSQPEAYLAESAHAFSIMTLAGNDKAVGTERSSHDLGTGKDDADRVGRDGSHPSR